MSPRPCGYPLSLMVSVALTLIVAAIASVPHCAVLGVLLLPGLLGSAAIFPQGVESGHAVAFMILAELIEAFLLSIPIEIILRLLRGRHTALKS